MGNKALEVCVRRHRTAEQKQRVSDTEEDKVWLKATLLIHRDFLLQLQPNTQRFFFFSVPGRF